MEKAVTLPFDKLEKAGLRPFNRFDRVYAGDEFCQLKLPSARELSVLRAAFRGKITLASPVLTDSGLKRFKELIALAETWKDGCEAVVNDIGALSFLSGRGRTLLKVSLGRALAANFSSFTASAKFRELFGKTVNSVEVEDLTALNCALDAGIPELHLHYPFKFVAFSRCCYQSKRINSACAFECLEKPRFLEICPGPLKERLFLDGNAVFRDNRAMYRNLGGIAALAANPRITRIVYESFFFSGKPACRGLRPAALPAFQRERRRSR